MVIEELRRAHEGTLQQLVLPGGHLVWVHVVLLGDLGHGLLTPEGLQGYTRHERRGTGFLSVFALDLLFPQGACTAVRPPIVSSEFSA